MFGTVGLTNPLGRIACLVFACDLDQADVTHQKEGVMHGIPYTRMFEDKQNPIWPVLRDKPAESMYQTMQAKVFWGEIF